MREDEAAECATGGEMGSFQEGGRSSTSYLDQERKGRSKSCGRAPSMQSTIIFLHVSATVRRQRPAKQPRRDSHGGFRNRTASHCQQRADASSFIPVVANGQFFAVASCQAAQETSTCSSVSFDWCDVGNLGHAHRMKQGQPHQELCSHSHRAPQMTVVEIMLQYVTLEQSSQLKLRLECCEKRV